MRYLGETFDIHTGGMDHKEIHHPNEIAQSEASTGKLLANYWVHTAFMQVTGEKMSKSLGNTYNLYDIEKEGFSPLDLRYLYLQTHYRKDLNFTFAALEASANAYKKVVEQLSQMDEPTRIDKEADKKFTDAINDDLNMPQALAVMWDTLKSDLPSSVRSAAVYKMDRVLGLKLFENAALLNRDKSIVPEHIRQMVNERNALRKQHKFNLADQMRSKIEKLGYEIEDTEKKTVVKKRL
jgi:cysteinyl-tRNA synthetase